jgi:valyl-tRNA synthetase
MCRVFDPAPAAKEKHPVSISRANFIELCLKLTAEDEVVFKALWQRIGLSVDWKQEYSTIDDPLPPHCAVELSRSVSKGPHLRYRFTGDVGCRLSDGGGSGRSGRPQYLRAFSQHRFGIEGTDASFVIATTRPELLGACVGVTAHPDDERYKPYFGKRAVTPVFHVPVPIFPSELADPEKGTGILMVCTFGDATDVRWWREQGLPNRQIIGRNGRLIPITFGEPNWESLDPDAANAAYAQIAGKNTKQARKVLVEHLLGDALTAPPRPIEHAVKYFEKGDRPLEFISTRQWFVRLLDKKEELIELGDRSRGIPDFMRLRYEHLDREPATSTGASRRQRYFGVPFPVWYKLDEGNALYDEPILAAAETLPVDPASTPPPGFDEAQRDQPNGFTGESDVFDTWFTSSLTPQIGSRGRPTRSHVRESVPQRPAPAEPRDHPHLGVLHHREGVAARARCRGITWRSRAGCSIPTARRCPRARAT